MKPTYRGQRPQKYDRVARAADRHRAKVALMCATTIQRIPARRWNPVDDVFSWRSKVIPSLRYGEIGILDAFKLTNTPRSPRATGGVCPDFRSPLPDPARNSR